MIRVWGRSSARAVVGAVAVLALVLGIQVAPATVAPQEPADAADMSQFDYGNIIEDSIFFDGGAMNADQVQSFLNGQLPYCATTSCLKLYTQPIPDRASDRYCATLPGSGGAAISAAEIIARISRACAVNPKVLLVLLQKEQSLVTSTAPTPYQLTHATGYGCPDTAPCDPAFDGIFYQLYYAARAFQVYKQRPELWNFRANSWARIQYNPNPACGARDVWIMNAATAALYNYTPYVPNDAALANQYGTGDACSAYGNRNFYRMFVDWFGATHGPSVGGYFLDYYANSAGWLGSPLAPMECGKPDGGCTQQFQNGMVASSGHSLAAGVPSDFAQQWGWWGREYGDLGYPTSERICGDMVAACRQQFQGGMIVSSTAHGTHVLPLAYSQMWSWWGRETQFLGLPTSDRICTGSTCAIAFQGGTILYSPSVGTIVIPTATFSVWTEWGGEEGPLGLPIGSPSPATNTNYAQAFQGGTVTVTGGVGQVTSVTDPWYNALLANPWLGEELGDESCSLKDGACYQRFTNGWVVQSTAGVAAIPTAMIEFWGWYGREFGFLGFPTGSPSADPATGSYTQVFQGGTVAVTGGNRALTAATDPWYNAVVTSPWLGSTTGGYTCSLGGGGCYQPFSGGWVVRSAGGVAAVPAGAIEFWGWYGREYGFLGLPIGSPVGDPASGNYTQSFQGGTLAVTGGDRRLTSATDPWYNAVLTNGWLGASAGSYGCSLGSGGCYQPFVGGWVVRSASAVAPVPEVVRVAWGWYGREYGPLGFPTGAPSVDPTTGNYAQSFQGGTITVAGGTPSVTILPSPWEAALTASPWLGTATGAKTAALKNGAVYQPYTGGWIVASTTGTFAVPEVVRVAWGWYGREYGPLGFPTGAPSADPTTGNYAQNFQGGTITVAGGTPSVLVVG